MIRYFKKSFVRYLAYGLAIALLSFIFGLFKVKAQMIEFDSTARSINGNANFPYTFTNSANGNYTTRIDIMYDTQDLSQWPYDNPYIIISACTTGNYSPSNYNIVRTNAPNTSCANSCYKQEVKFFMTNQSCPTSSFFGRKLYVILEAQKLDVGSGNSRYYLIDDSITFKSDLSYPTSTTIYGIYMSDTDFSSSIQNNTTNAELNNIELRIQAQMNLAHQDSQATITAIGGVASAVGDLQTNIDDAKDTINQSINDLNSNVTDSNPPDNLDALSNSAGWLPPGPVDGILNLPLTLFNNMFNNLSKTCEPVILPLPFVGSNLELPCVNSLYSQMEGVSTWVNGVVGVVASAIILYYYLLHLYKYVDDTLTFRENNLIDNWSGV